MTNYTITVSEAELALVHAAIGRDVEVRKAPERKARKPLDRERTDLAIATGDDHLDAFMRRSRDRRGVPKAWAPPAATYTRFPFGLKKKMSTDDRVTLASWNDLAVAAWKRKGYEVTIERVEGGDRSLVAIDGRNVTVVGLEQ